MKFINLMAFEKRENTLSFFQNRSIDFKEQFAYERFLIFLYH